MSKKKDISLENVCKSVENFTVDFHKVVAGKTKGNFVSSALSAHVVLAMAAYGAREKTAKEMRKVLHLPTDDKEAYEGFQKFIDSLNNVSNVLLKLANKIFASDSIKVINEFERLTKEYFRSKCEVLNFHNPVESAKTMNQWCIYKTDGKIQGILSPDDVKPNFVMVLLNAVYFKGNWKETFDAEKTDMQPFHIDEDTVIQVPTMHILKELRFKESKILNAQFVQIPYENDDVSMEIILPKEIGGLEYIENNLDKINEDEESDYWMEEVTLSLPKFKIETKVDLNSHLLEMGMEDAFVDTANFGGIFDRPVKIDRVLQKAFIEVNEDGCEAAAATGLSEALCSFSFKAEMKVNKPFLYRILYKKSTLFSGRVVNPLENY